jgi:hypothetical protein
MPRMGEKPQRGMRRRAPLIRTLRAIQQLDGPHHGPIAMLARVGLLLVQLQRIIMDGAIQAQHIIVLVQVDGQVVRLAPGGVLAIHGDLRYVLTVFSFRGLLLIVVQSAPTPAPSAPTPAVTGTPYPTTPGAYPRTPAGVSRFDGTSYSSVATPAGGGMYNDDPEPPVEDGE